MHDKYLKIRLTNDQYDALKIRAAIEGKRLGTFSRELLQREQAESDICEILTKVELAIKETKVDAFEKPTSLLDYESRRILQEILLLNREFALNSNAQILHRVTAQLAKFS